MKRVAPAASAHHTIGGNYDTCQKINVKGVISRIDWQNPHITVVLGVTDVGGKTVEWFVDGPQANGAVKAGWTKDLLKAGTTIVVVGLPSLPRSIMKDPAHSIFMTELTLPDGRRLSFVPAPNCPSTVP
jgi:hypothetical protein